MSYSWRRGPSAVPTALLSAQLAGVLLTSAACYPGQIEGVGEPDLVLTVYDVDASFGTFATYAMPDTIIRVDALGSDLPSDSGLDQQVLDAVATEFAALGYARLDASSETSPDVVVALTVSADELPLWSADEWWSYWRWYPGWGEWYPAWEAGWGPHYPWADAYRGVRAPGTLLITMLDADQPTSEPAAIPAVWAGVISGLFSGSEASVRSRFQGLIRQAFDQSPYL